MLGIVYHWVYHIYHILRICGHTKAGFKSSAPNLPLTFLPLWERSHKANPKPSTFMLMVPNAMAKLVLVWRAFSNTTTMMPWLDV